MRVGIRSVYRFILKNELKLKIEKEVINGIEFLIIKHDEIKGYVVTDDGLEFVDKLCDELNLNYDQIMCYTSIEERSLEKKFVAENIRSGLIENMIKDGMIYERDNSGGSIIARFVIRPVAQ